MSLAVVMSRALYGLEAPSVRVEVYLANGLPSFTLVGLADTEVKEARERVRAALSQSGFDFPHNRRVTVSLAPADLPKESGRFDLPIALGVLAAAGVIDSKRLQGLEFAGELSLDGALRPVRGALALALAARCGGRTLVLPTGSAQEAAQVPGLDVRAAAGLLEVVQALNMPPQDSDHTLPGLARAQPPAARPAPDGPDLREVRGQPGARRALEVAAAGRHALLLVGPPGSGKSMLAERLVSLLPPLSDEQALESAALLSLSWSGGSRPTFGQRPMRAPHHSASAAALVGGGCPPRPGEISLAHRGVLFLDELPEFPRKALEALREPLQTGQITLSRAARQASFPAQFQLVAAMNPCPCGWRGADPTSGRVCRCTPDAVARYQSRLSGPLLDRIDLVVEVGPLPAARLLHGSAEEGSAAVRERVAAAWARRQAREATDAKEPATDGTPASPTASRAWAAPAALGLLQRAAEQWAWSGRAVHRTLAVARTVADLAGTALIEPAHMAEAIQWRRSLDPQAFDSARAR